MKVSSMTSLAEADSAVIGLPLGQEPATLQIGSRRFGYRGRAFHGRAPVPTIRRIASGEGAGRCEAPGFCTIPERSVFWI
jgi:hypothetical protein